MQTLLNKLMCIKQQRESQPEELEDEEWDAEYLDGYDDLDDYNDLEE